MGFMDVKRAQCPRIIEDDARSVSKLNGRTRESRKRVGSCVDVPITSHPKMNVDHPTIVEHDELMLATSLHRTNRRARKGAKAARRIVPAQTAVEHPHVGDGLPDNSLAENARGVFDFGKLWHER